MNFHNPAEMTRVKDVYYLQNEASGPPIVGRGEVRGGLLEMSNVNMKEDIAYFQQAKSSLIWQISL